MENRKYNGQTFYSECLNLETTLKNIIEEIDDFVDFYIFLDRALRGNQIISFHVPFSYVKEYIDSSQKYYSNYDNPLKEELIHQELLECLIDDTKSTEEIYILFIKFLCYGMRFRFSINKFSEMNFGIMATFDDEFNLKEKLIIEPEMNQSFHCQITEE